MSEKPRSFILQPSRLGRQATEGEDRAAVARPNFTGDLLDIDLVETGAV